MAGQNVDGLFGGFWFGVVVTGGSFPSVILFPQVNFEHCRLFLFFEGGAHANRRIVPVVFESDHFLDAFGYLVETASLSES